ncbi:DMT family transporter [Desulfopila aestuarii]|uniref:Putative multidrug resistance efflux transporter n=1 Tax=Desulfopila aestuarii DSM 18488 TaxID=1121416 RepID=A0A1M7Y3M5_9BACT|nr:multidrug resistance efflux transporter family protein [Desulfopila aestuarii]SHO46804.1 Putative multidrug resistance efflux transporter [Desulfopila aestuarii DSM 18488]
MLKLILLGILSGAFFSSTFVINEMMRVQGGHWLWSASLRYLFMIVFLSIVVLASGGIRQMAGVLRLFADHWRFWMVSGGIGFGAFYALVCFAADFSPGWVIAATWQFTIVASLFALLLFGRSFPRRVWFFSLIIFIGVVMVNLAEADGFDLRKLLMGGIPVIIASFCYPLGNQLVWEASNGNNGRLPKIASPFLHNPFNKVLLMSLGSLPLWAVLVVFIHPAAPSVSQVMNTALVALFSGLIATTIFLFARNRAENSSELAGVDATQSSEVVFALLGGMLFLHTPLPGMLPVLGIVLIMFGLILFVRYQKM